MNAPRRFSQAISEGDGISVIARVDAAQAAGRAEEEGAEALLVQGGGEQALDGIRSASSLPVLFHWDEVHGGQLEGADACLVDSRGERNREWLRRVHGEVGDSHEIVLRIADEEDLALALEEFDPEIFILAAPEAEGEEALERVLDLLPDVPAGKLAIAELPGSTREDVAALERAGIDGVIVEPGSVAGLVADPPPEV